MSSLIFRGITVELSAEDDHFLRDVLHLVSELKLNDRYMDKADLLSRESSPGVWDANEPLILPEIVVHFTLSVFAELGGEGLQLVASQELYGTDLCDRLREPVAILLDGHENYPSMILKAKITTAADIFRQALGGEQSNNQTGESRVQDSAPISGDQTGNFEGLLQLLSQVNPDNDGSFPSYGSDNFGNCEDINRRIEMEEKAVRSTPDSHPDKPSRLSNLGTSLLRRFERLGNVDDLNSAIARHQAAVDLTPNGHPDKHLLLNNLGSSLLRRFERLGNVDDLDSATVRLQAAVNLTPDGHPDKYLLLNNLGSSLLRRFERLGNVDDLDRAIARLQTAVNPTPDGHPDKPSWLNNLGSSLLRRFERLGNVDDLNSAIARHQAAVNLSPDGHPYKSSLLNNLGSSLLRRFERLGNVDDLDSGIERLQAAVNLSPDGHPYKPGLLNNLGSSLIRRFERLGNLDDLNSAIARNQAAVNLTPDGHPDKPSRLNNLGNYLIRRFEHLGNVDDAEASIVQFSAASLSPVGYPSVRLAAAREWIGAAITTNHTSLLTACECATTIIPLVAWLGLSILDRHQHLAQIGGIVRDVASIAISLGKCDKAIEWLEQGRSIVWTQILQLRTPVDELGAVEPDLAGRLLHVSSLLDQGMKSTKSHHEGEPSLEEEAQQYRALARERDEIIERIRSLPRFGDFLRPPKLHQLVNAAKEGPVVVLNVSNIRCDALALVYGADEVIHIPLPDLTSEKITQLQAEFNSILKSSGVRLRAVRDEEVEVGGDEGCKRILAELWDYLVKPVLDSLAFCIHFLVSGGV
ncbi:hypothetical protein FRC19_003508 [Serendipita sp. 401]|nr:hypothetical protein FRC19_003508 [Serendipita sp. 401]